MNCRKFARLLVGHGLSRATDNEQEEFKQHLSSCEDCARDLELHSRLAAIRVPPMPAKLEARCRAAVAGQKRRKSSRKVLFGAIFLIAAAAAMLGLHFASRNRAAPQPELHVIGQPKVTDPEIQLGTLTERDAATAAEHGPEESAPAEAPTFTVLVKPLALGAVHPAIREFTGMYHAAVINQLGSVPGLTLIAPEQQGNTATPTPDFQITVTVEDQGPPNASPESRTFQIEIKAVARPQGDSRTFSVWSAHQVVGPCSPTAMVDACPPNRADADRRAASSVRLLRSTVFPHDSSFLISLGKQLGDRQLPFMLRYEALFLLLKEVQNPEDIDAAIISAAVDLLPATPDSQVRAQFVRALRGIADPALVQPLIDLLDREVDETARLEIVTTLAMNYSSNAEVRARFEILARSTGEPIVRQLALRALTGENEWRAYVLDSLKDMRLSGKERIQPLTQMLKITQSDEMQEFLDNGEVLSLIAQVLPAAMSTPNASTSTSPERRDDPTREITNLLNVLSFSKNPTAIDILLDILNNPDQPMRLVAADQLAARHLANARVHKALEDIAASDRDPIMKSFVMGALAIEAASSKGVK